MAPSRYFKRKGSSFSTETWAEEYGFGGWGWINYEHAGIVTLGPVDGLSSITSKEINVSGKMNGNKYQADPRFSTYSVNYYGEDLVPNAGYYIYYRKENNEFDFVRLYVSSYKMDKDGNITSITIQYQKY